MSTDPNDYANPYVLGPENFNPGPTLREQVAMMILHRLLGATLRPGTTEPTTADLCNAAWRTADMFIAAGEETAQETGGAMRNETAAAESPVAAEAAENDKAIEEMNEDRVEKLAGVLLLAYRGPESEEGKNRVLRQVFGSLEHPESRKSWLSVARAAIEHLKGESKWKAVALDLCSHLRKALPVMDDAREAARHLNQQYVVEAFERQTDAARAAIAIAEGGSK